MKKILFILVLIALVGGTAAWYWKHNGTSQTTVTTAPVKRGEVIYTIGATGTVEPEEVIDVGAQVAGKIVEFGKDPNDSRKEIDYGTEVRKGRGFSLRAYSPREPDAPTFR